METGKNDIPKSLCDYLSLLQLKYDCETICSLVSSLQKDGVTSFGIIPYISLTTASALEILASDKNLFQESEILQIKDVRLKLKIFEDGYGKSKKMLLNIDYLQNQVFKNMLKFGFMKTWNIHQNLGIYTDANKRVVGNTQYSYYLLQDNRLLKKSIDKVAEAYSASPDRFNLDEQTGRDCYEYAYKCGQIIGSIQSGFENFDAPVSIATKRNVVQYHYADYNTNVKSSLFPAGEDGKATTLYLLHILSTINFLLYVLNSYENDDYGWWLKVNYIAYHYAIHKLTDLQQYFMQNKLMTEAISNYFDELDIENAPYINGTFRNCVMHSQLVDKNEIAIIDPAYLDKSKPLFGLVETCFNGMDYQRFKLSLVSETIKISNVLSRWLQIESLQVKPL